MNLYHFLKERTKLFTPEIIGTFVLSGVLNFSLIIIILISVSQDDVKPIWLAFFVVLVLFFIFIQKRSMKLCTEAVEELVTKIRLQMLDKIRRSNLVTFEKIGSNDLLTILTQETMSIAEASKTAPRVFTGAATMVASLIYIFVVSPVSFMVVFGLLALGSRYYLILTKNLETEFASAQQMESRLFGKINYFITGFKQFKADDAKNKDIFDNYLTKEANRTKDVKIKAQTHVDNIIIFMNTFNYNILAILIFIFPIVFTIDMQTLIQVVTLTLFIITGPLGEVIGAVPMIERANASIASINRMEETLDTIEDEQLFDNNSPKKLTAFKQLTCTGLAFEYRNSPEDYPFKIGPVDITLNQGEIVFLRGGNGSGKTTFLHVLAGLYPHDTGTIKYNNRVVRDSILGEYRSKFAIIFQDMHLFDRLYGMDKVDQQRANELLERMHLDEKTSIFPDGNLSSTQLSMGQKKRLLLIAAELEDKTIYIFDEWAADQDPTFREYFYKEYLPELKKNGKTVFAITHDEKYYSLADRLLEMESGELYEIEKKSRNRSKKT